MDIFVNLYYNHLINCEKNIVFKYFILIVFSKRYFFSECLTFMNFLC